MTATVPGPVDVICLGESMVTFLPTGPGRLADVPSFVRGIGGAESNVACGLAAAGHAVKWVGRVGADGFGEHLVAAIASYGVDTSEVQRDPHRPTGIYFRTAGERATGEVKGEADRDGEADGEADGVGADGECAADLAEVVYYRAGSAASAMSPSTIAYRDMWSGRILHLSGITAALSADCLALMRELTTRVPGRPLVSFDVNYRVNLWRDAQCPRVLLDLARGADIVFVGEDEAEAAWGLRGASVIRAALPEPDVLVVKQGARGAVAYARCAEPFPAPRLPTPPLPAPRLPAPALPEPGADPRPPGMSTGRRPRSPDGPSREPAPDTVTFVPALAVDVVAPVGAGDAFAAGFLSATLRGLPAEDRLRHGHLMAAATLTVAGDLAAPPERAHADRLAALDARAWGTLRLGPGWTAATAQDPQEVRTA
ncbi:sugar kinase [Streptomyces sp. NBC_01142]|uniref:sugar kinase n=1 Tax=Streptomyces sp. NBC_01142 TaxID=2975865 RepID=UPI00224D73C0|nr:sugar kinase [Streptomyces sp. NBC_01142]MCX4819061.1 sugar kinase [Streptomyces sp. NBC_01142]